MTRGDFIEKELRSREKEQLSLRAEQEELMEQYKKKIPLKMYQQMNRVHTGLLLLRRETEDPTEHLLEGQVPGKESNTGQDSGLQQVKNLKKELDALVREDERLERELLAQCAHYNKDADRVKKTLQAIREELNLSSGNLTEMQRQKRLDQLEQRLKQLSQMQQDLCVRQKQSGAQLNAQDALHDAFHKKLNTELGKAMKIPDDQVPQALGERIAKQLEKEEAMLEKQAVQLSYQKSQGEKLCADLDAGEQEGSNHEDPIFTKRKELRGQQEALRHKIWRLKERQIPLAKYQSDQCDYLWKLKAGLTPEKPTWGGPNTPKNYHDFLRMQQQVNQEMTALVPQLEKMEAERERRLGKGGAG